MEEQIKQHFKNLGIRISVEETDEGEVKITPAAPVDFLSPERLYWLLNYYFGEIHNEPDPPYINDYYVKAADFNPCGHGKYGICKKCGCTDGDGCEDIETGTCFWVREDLCSACATPEERRQVLDEMKKRYFK